MLHRIKWDEGNKREGEPRPACFDLMLHLAQACFCVRIKAISDVKLGCVTRNVQCTLKLSSLMAWHGLPRWWLKLMLLFCSEVEGLDDDGVKRINKCDLVWEVSLPLESPLTILGMSYDLLWMCPTRGKQ